MADRTQYVRRVGKGTLVIPPYERKVHLHHDNAGATFGPKKQPFANTLCRMNSTSPDMRITHDPALVTCKICRKDARFKAYLAPPSPVELITELTTPSKPALQTRYRLGWRGKLILQVAEPFTIQGPVGGIHTRTRWRDATLEDLGLGVV